MIKNLWNHHRAALLAFVLALSALGFFGARTITAAIYWMDPAHQQQPLAGWMTPRYVGQSYGLPRDIVQDALLLDPAAPPRRVSIAEIAAQNNVSLAELQNRIDAAALAWATSTGASRDD